jgi:hypothetical protein
MTPLAEMAPYLALILVGFLPNEVWRMLGLLVSRGIDENSELLVWVRAVATAVLAGVIAKVTLMPPGALAGVPLSVRVAAIVVAFVAFLSVRRSVFASVLAGEVALVAGALLFGP